MATPIRTTETRRLGGLLRALRQSLGVEPAEVARALGIEPESYLQWERGYNSFSQKSDAALARGLGVPVSRVEALFGRHPDSGVPARVGDTHRDYWAPPPELRDLLGQALPPTDVDLLVAVVQGLVSLDRLEGRAILESFSDSVNGRLSRLQAEREDRERERRRQNGDEPRGS